MEINLLITIIQLHTKQKIKYGLHAIHEAVDIFNCLT